MSLLLVHDQSLEKHLTRAAMKLQVTASSPTLFSGFRDSMKAAMDIDFERVGSTALVQVSGPLSYKYDFWTWIMDGNCYQGLAGKFIAAVNDDSIERIVLAMDTPGGDYTGCPELAEIIRAGRDRKEVVAVVDPLCASAGLWIASQASRIVMMRTGEIGSLGVQITYASYAKYFEEKGIDLRIIRAAISPDKNIAHPYEPIKDEAVAVLKSRCDSAGVEFIQAVATGRGVSVEAARSKFGGGLMLSGDEAIEAGLVDDIGTLASVLAEKKTVSRAAKTIGRRAFSNAFLLQ
jgi:capsid assembly protease